VAIEALPDFDYRGIGSFRNWLLACAHNVLRGQRRKAQAMKRDIGREVSATLLGDGSDTYLVTQYAHIATPSRHAVAREQIEIPEVAFDRLSERDQEVILLNRLHGLSHLEVAERLGISHGAARQALHQALKWSPTMSCGLPATFGAVVGFRRSSM